MKQTPKASISQPQQHPTVSQARVSGRRTEYNPKAGLEPDCSLGLGFPKPCLKGNKAVHLETATDALSGRKGNNQ